MQIVQNKYYKAKDQMCFVSELKKKTWSVWFPSPFQLYYHGEPISVNVHVTNNSTKTVKRVKISGEMNI